MKLNYDDICAYLDEKNSNDVETKKYTQDLLPFCKKVEPYLVYYKRQIKSYNDTAHNILKNDPQLIRKQKCGIITTLVSSFIGLAYTGISSFLQYRRHKALLKAVKTMDSRTSFQCNKLMPLENSMIMYGIYNEETHEQPINIVNHTGTTHKHSKPHLQYHIS